MKKFIYLFLFLFSATLINSCQNEDVLTSNPQKDLAYKEKLEKLITLKKPSDLEVAKMDKSSVLKFENYEEAYNFFKNNNKFVSDTITTKATLVNVDYSNSKSVPQQTTSTITTGIDYVPWSANFANSAGVSGSLFNASVSITSSMTFTISYAYRQNSGIRNYYSAQMVSAQTRVNSISFTGVGISTGNLSGSTIMHYSSGFSGSWTQYASTFGIIGGIPVNQTIEIKGQFNVNPGSIGGSSIPTPTVSQYITVRFI